MGGAAAAKPGPKPAAKPALKPGPKPALGPAARSGPGARTKGFDVFVDTKRPALQLLHPKLSAGDLRKMLSERWKAMDDEEKAPFNAQIVARSGNEFKAIVRKPTEAAVKATCKPPLQIKPVKAHGISMPMSEADYLIEAATEDGAGRAEAFFEELRGQPEPEADLRAAQKESREALRRQQHKGKEAAINTTVDEDNSYDEDNNVEPKEVACAGDDDAIVQDVDATGDDEEEEEEPLPDSEIARGRRLSFSAALPPDELSRSRRGKCVDAACVVEADGDDVMDDGENGDDAAVWADLGALVAAGTSPPAPPPSTLPLASADEEGHDSQDEQERAARENVSASPSSRSPPPSRSFILCSRTSDSVPCAATALGSLADVESGLAHLMHLHQATKRKRLQKSHHETTAALKAQFDATLDSAAITNDKAARARSDRAAATTEAYRALALRVSELSTRSSEEQRQREKHAALVKKSLGEIERTKRAGLSLIDQQAKTALNDALRALELAEQRRQGSRKKAKRASTEDLNMLLTTVHRMLE